ncbi:MAG: SoxR reducing system RseC family protein [Thermosipho sp. (in: Bacteria)]|nr:SoxR reducing system RseC family protein [Thermosipho sp. (in: thermotogales)]
MKEVFKVLRVDDKYIYVEKDMAACGSCQLSGSCSFKNVAEVRLEKKKELEILPGDLLVVDMKIRPAMVAFLIYGLPLIFLIFGIGLGTFLNFSEYVSFAIGISLMSVAFLINFFIDKKFKPEIVDVKRNQGVI